MHLKMYRSRWNPNSSPSLWLLRTPEEFGGVGLSERVLLKASGPL